MIVSIEFNGFVRFTGRHLLRRDYRLTQRRRRRFLILIVFAALLLLNGDYLGELGGLSSAGLFRLCLLVCVVIFVREGDGDAHRLSVESFVVVTRSFSSLLRLRRIDMLRSALSFYFGLLFLELVGPRRPVDLVYRSTSRDHSSRHGCMFGVWLRSFLCWEFFRVGGVLVF